MKDIKTKGFKILIFIFFGLYTCSKSPEFFIGKWQILSVVENNTSINLNENWMHLKNDGTFKSYDGDWKKTEIGKWEYEINDKKIFIDGNGEEGDSFWYLTIKQDTLIFQSTSNDSYLIAKKIE